MKTVDSGELIVDSGDDAELLLRMVEKERDNLKAELTSLRRICQGATCIHCGEVFEGDTPLDEISSEALKAHIRVCTKHPLAAVTAEFEKFKARIARDRDDAIHPFWEVCEEILKHFPERGPAEEPPPASWPAEWPIWQALTEVGYLVFGVSGDAYLYTTGTGDICNWSFDDLGVGERVRHESRAEMAALLAELRAEVPWTPGSVLVRGAWERLQRVSEILWRERSVGEGVDHGSARNGAELARIRGLLEGWDFACNDCLKLILQAELAPSSKSPVSDDVDGPFCPFCGSDDLTTIEPVVFEALSAAAKAIAEEEAMP